MRAASSCACLRRSARIIPREAAVVFSRPPQLGLRVCKDRHARKDEASSRASFLGLFFYFYFFQVRSTLLACLPVCLPAVRPPKPSGCDFRGHVPGSSRRLSSGGAKVPERQLRPGERERARSRARLAREVTVKCGAALPHAAQLACRHTGACGLPGIPGAFLPPPTLLFFLFSLALHNFFFFLLLQSGSGAVNNAGRAEENAALS